jgi:hypothetical protein
MLVTFAALLGPSSVHGCDVSIIRADHVVLRATVAESQADKHSRNKCYVLAELKQVVRVLAIAF